MDATMANLSRLAEKPSVKATIVLSRQTGDIVQSSGMDVSEDINGDTKSRAASVDEVARLVFDHVKASVALAQQLNGTEDDELKLLRIRTKRNELMIVPGEYLTQTLQLALTLQMHTTLPSSFTILLQLEITNAPQKCRQR